MRKALGLLVIAVAVAASLALTGHKVFRGEVIIAAPPEKIWAALTDPASYPEWNPVFLKVEGTYAVGETVTTTVLFDDGSKVPLSGDVVAMEPNREMRQKGGFPGFVTFDHRWTLEPAEGGTRVIQYEEDRGLYLWFWDSSWVQPAYQKAVEALKAYVEGG